MFHEYVGTFRKTHVINPNNGNLYRLYLSSFFKAVKPVIPVLLYLQVLEMCYFKTDKKRTTNES